MPLEIVTVPALDVFLNYYFLIRDTETDTVAVVDCGGAAPVLSALDAHGWTLDEIWLTHHHWDHVDGVSDLVAATGAKVRGNSAEAHRLPPLDLEVTSGTSFDFCGTRVDVLPVDGHARGHIAFHIPAAKALFSGDSLMALGCGRLLEGTAEEMHDTLTRLAALPADTLIYSGHEYTKGNAAFALTIEASSEALQERAAAINDVLDAGGATVPSLLSEELATNPFLRTHLPQIKSAVGMEGASDIAVFAEIRARKDSF
ncbi:hydroxyacylglutathione hydrolase [Celeribacter sp.]|uniref:hydroxyacylglutathione hydrolase n=1 Tax=Celeribacter sp. TaxID=1890673 RepID=UPI003A93BD4B